MNNHTQYRYIFNYQFLVPQLGKCQTENHRYINFSINSFGIFIWTAKSTPVISKVLFWGIDLGLDEDLD